MSTNLGDQVLKQLSTSRLYWQPAANPAGAGWIDFGNVVDYKDDPKVERVPHMQSKKGFKRLDFELIKTIGSKKSFVLDEHFADVLNLQFLSANSPFQQKALLTADTTLQDASDGNDTADEVPLLIINPVIAGRVYDLGYQQVTVDSVTDVNNTVLTPGVHYTVDAAAGMLTALNGPINNRPNPPWTVIYSAALVNDLNFKAFSSLLATGNFKHVEFDQFSPVPLFTETFSGQVYVTAWGDNKTDAFTEFTIEVITQNNIRTQRST